jgi:hypothetical protein
MLIGILLGCFLTIISILAVPNLFVSKKEQMSVFFKKMLLYQGLAGLVACIVGIIALIHYAQQIATLVAVLWLTSMLCTATLASYAFLLIYNLIYLLFLSKEKNSVDNLQKMTANIMPLQGKLSILGIVIGVWSVMAAVMFTA